MLFTNIKRNLLGVIGGVGPLATAYFMERVITFTDAGVDQEHIDMIVLNHCSIPDRTAYILDNTMPNPLPELADDVKRLEQMGVKFIVTPCNTAHYFYNDLVRISNTPILNMIEETASVLKRQGSCNVGIMATKGTIKTGLFQDALRRKGIDTVILDDVHQGYITSIIFDSVKANKRVDMNKFYQVVEYFKARGCDRIILGCTELSVVKRDYKLDKFFLDSLDALVVAVIRECNAPMVDNYIINEDFVE